MAVTEIRINQMIFKVLPCASPDGDYWKDVNAGKWEKETLVFMRNYIKPNKDYLELGGWIGSTAMMAYTYNPRRVYSIESDPANFHVLKYNLESNYMTDKVKAYNVCLTDKELAGKIIMFGTPNNAKPNSSSHRIDNGSRIKVRTVDAWKFLQKHCDLENTNCINIDIEGSERYLCETLSKLPGEKSILMSFHSPFWGKDRREIAKNIMEASKEYFFIDPISLKELSHKTILNRLLDDSPCIKNKGLKGQFFSVIMQKGV